MSTPLPAYDPALPDTNYGFSYEYGVDIWIPELESGKWQPIRRITAVDPQTTPRTTEAATYDDRGSANSPKIGEDFTLGFQVQVQRTPTSGLYLPEVEQLMTLAGPEAVGNAAFGRFRWYDKPVTGQPNPDDAYEGEGTVSINRGSTGNDGVGSWTISVTGKGRRTRIQNPFTGWVDSGATAWAAETAYTVGDKATVTGGTLEATVAGTSDVSAPVLPGAVDGTVTDGTVTWKRII